MDAFFKVSSYAPEGLGHFFRGSIISTIGPSLLPFGHLNIPRVLEGYWNIMCVVSRRKLGAQKVPMMLKRLALGGLLGPEMLYQQNNENA